MAKPTFDKIVSVHNVVNPRDAREIAAAKERKEIEFLGDLVQRGISARKSDDDVFKHEYLPLEDSKASGSSNSETSIRQTRDCKKETLG